MLVFPDLWPAARGGRACAMRAMCTHVCSVWRALRHWWRWWAVMAGTRAGAACGGGAAARVVVLCVVFTSVHVPRARRDALI